MWPVPQKLSQETIYVPQMLLFHENVVIIVFLKSRTRFLQNICLHLYIR